MSLIVQFLAIVAICVLAAVAYGIVHDQVTARICVEYFTIGHEPIFGTEDPTILGIGWGILATWWVGVMLGVPLAMAARIGKAPKRTAASLVKPLAVLMVVSGLCAALSGICGALLANSDAIVLVEPMKSAVPLDKHTAFLADLWIHNASYASGFIGGGMLVFRVWLKRRLASMSPATAAAPF